MNLCCLLPKRINAVITAINNEYSLNRKIVSTIKIDTNDVQSGTISEKCSELKTWKTHQSQVNVLFVFIEE